MIYDARLTFRAKSRVRYQLEFRFSRNLYQELTHMNKIPFQERVLSPPGSLNHEKYELIFGVRVDGSKPLHTLSPSISASGSENSLQGAYGVFNADSTCSGTFAHLVTAT